MKQNSFLFFLLFAILVLAIVHSLGTYFFWYWRLSWLDLFVHFLGGFWIAGMFLWIFFLKKFIVIKKTTGIKVVFLALCTVLIAGFLWEFFELKIGATFTTYEDYVYDTVTDFFAALAGGFIVSIYFLKKYKMEIV